MTAADVARALKNLKRGPFLAGMVKESSDVDSIPALERVLTVEGWRIAEGDPEASIHQLERGPFEKWPYVHGQGYIRRLAGLAVMEFCDETPLVCPLCKGRGSTKVSGNGVSCSRCEGRGGLPLNPFKRAELATIPYTSWKSGWGKRYEAIFQTLDIWVGEAKSHLSRNINEREVA
jgi:hypothetical protein